MIKIVTIDFDDTLSRPEVQNFAKELMSKGIDVWILTSRYDELHKHLYTDNPTNEDLYKVAESLAIPKHKIIFTNMHMKCRYLIDTKVVWHMDDDIEEIIGIDDEDLGIHAIYYSHTNNAFQYCRNLLEL